MGRHVTKGYVLLSQALANEQVDAGFFIMGGPINDAVTSCMETGIRMIDVRHEQAAGMMAHAYARTLGRPGVCITSSGPGTLNLSTSLASALIDCAPVVALGGSSPISQLNRGSFQEIDQVAAMRPVTKWAERVYEAHRIPEYVSHAFRQAVSGRPGPVYLDLPGDILYQDVDEAAVPFPGKVARQRPAASDESIRLIADALGRAERPVLVWGSGVLWSGAADALRAFVEATGVPFYSTPQSRGAIPEDHPYFYASARSDAFREADLVVVVGARLNFMFNYGQSPRFSPSATFIQIDIDHATLDSSPRPDIAVLGDAATVLDQITRAVDSAGLVLRFAPWRSRLQQRAESSSAKHEHWLSSDDVPIHPLRLCREIRDFIPRDAVLVVDGQEILNYARQSIPSFMPAHRLNSGPFGTMGVGVPFGIGAKVARGTELIVVLTGDGAFGMNGMELDTAIRHALPVLVVVSLNGGWTADPDHSKPGRDLGYTRYDKVAEALGCHAEFVEQPGDIRPALDRAAAAVAKGQSAVVNVVTDWRARSETVAFTQYMT